MRDKNKKRRSPGVRAGDDIAGGFSLTRRQRVHIAIDFLWPGQSVPSCWATEESLDRRGSSERPWRDSDVFISVCFPQTVPIPGKRPICRDSKVILRPSTIRTAYWKFRRFENEKRSSYCNLYSSNNI